jgi:hypothetical protein
MNCTSPWQHGLRDGLPLASENGGMLGSDMAFFVASRPTELVDAHVIETYLPEPDDCQQDWILVSSSLSYGEFLIFEATRKLDTGDPQDKAIIPDADPAIPQHRIIAAWGDSEEIAYHGTNVARGSVRFYASDNGAGAFEQAMLSQASGSFFVGSKNFTVPSTSDTEYIEFCQARSDLIGQGVPDTSDALNIIGFRPVLAEATARFVHHFTMHASYNISDTPDNQCENRDDFNYLVYGTSLSWDGCMSNKDCRSGHTHMSYHFLLSFHFLCSVGARRAAISSTVQSGISIVRPIRLPVISNPDSL